MTLYEFITNVRVQLFAPKDGDGWANAELVGYTNRALRATVAAKPDAYTKREFVSLAAGNSQVIPDDGVLFVDLTQNEVSGLVVTQVDDALLDAANRYWPASTQQTDVEHYSADPRDPRRFNVFPPNDGAGSVQMLYGALPATLAGPVVSGGSEDIPLDTVYQEALTNHVLAQAWTKPSKRQNLAEAAQCMQAWGAALGLKAKGQQMMAPKVAVSEGKQ